MVHVQIESQRLHAEPGTSLFECADRAGLPITNSCGREGTCHECLVEVSEGAELLNLPETQERHLRGNFRLACRALVRSDRGTIRFRRLRWSGVRILDRGHEVEAAPADRSLDPAVTRDGDVVLLEGDEIARSSGPLYGLGLDLGTTTVVVRLVDLETGQVKATQAFENPQRFAGSDVMTRIAYAAADDDGRLRSTLCAYINQAVATFEADPGDIYEASVVGNPTMRDIFFGLDVGSLGQSPYRSGTEHEFRSGHRATTALSAPARKLGLRTHPRARAYGLPLVGGHVGADAAACLLAVGAPSEERLIALVDIGTNTELLIGNRRKMLAASCPAGPAFEGGAIACGMPAFPGAIEGLSLGDGEPTKTRVIGGGMALGICGSGLVAALGELRRTERMSELGRLGGDRVALEDDIYISEADISQLAQAKAAQVAGWTLVMRRIGADYAAIERLYLAGGFASHIDVDAALRIGLIPPVPGERIQAVGNAAIEGATLALCSLSLRRQLESFVQAIEHVELEADESFFEVFADGCRFVPIAQQASADLTPKDRAAGRD